MYADVRDMLQAFSEHPDRHGWHPFYEVLGRLMDDDRGPLARIVSAGLAARPQLSVAHLTTLLCVSIKSVIGDDWRECKIFEEDPAAADAREADLAAIVEAHEEQIAERIRTRQHAFSCPRRYLVPQVVISRYAARAGLTGVRLIDLGTGAGILPRQLNSRACYERFAPGLTWAVPGFAAVPEFRPIPFESHWGMDLPPVADLDWVRACYGPSEYYDERFEELRWALDLPEVRSVRLRTAELDLLDTERVGPFLAAQQFNVVTCSFVLYQYARPLRAQIVRTVVANLAPGGLFLSVEPTAELTKPGCLVRLYLPGNEDPFEFVEVSNGHFFPATVRPGRDFDAFRRQYL